eukprot:14693673-Alexandrium_andersonii.AAC.1
MEEPGRHRDRPPGWQVRPTVVAPATDGAGNNWPRGRAPDRRGGDWLSDRGRQALAKGARAR